MLDAIEIPRDTRDISGLLHDEQGRLRALDASTYREKTTHAERLYYCNLNAAYILPTIELVGFLRYVIGGRRAIEIGSGNGALARALDIQATDSHQQEQPLVRAYYDAIGAKTVNYGRNVDRVDASAAIAKYRPQVVIGAWVTHRDSTPDHALQGNQFGIEEEAVIANCQTYLMVGNHRVHRNKPIWKLPHRIIEPDWLYSRSFNGRPDFIACWGNPERFP